MGSSGTTSHCSSNEEPVDRPLFVDAMVKSKKNNCEQKLCNKVVRYYNKTFPLKEERSLILRAVRSLPQKGREVAMKMMSVLQARNTGKKVHDKVAGANDKIGGELLGP